MKKGDVVRIEYVGKLDSGEIFDLTDEQLAKKEKIYNSKARYGSVPVLIGADFVLPGLDKELERMEAGEEKEITIEPQEAFGNRNSEMVKTLPLKAFREAPRPGMVVDFSNAVGRVQAVSGGRVLVDFNNPLAGKRLHYKVKITEKIEGEKEKINAILEFFNVNADKIEIDENLVKIFAAGPKQVREKVASLILEHFGKNTVEFIERYEKKQ